MRGILHTSCTHLALFARRSEFGRKTLLADVTLLASEEEPQNLSLPPPAAPDQNHSLYGIDLYALVQPGTEVLLAISADADFLINPPQKWDWSTIGDGQSLPGQVGTCHHAIPQTGIRAPPSRNLLHPTMLIFQRA
jgi:hypothetical protein